MTDQTATARLHDEILEGRAEIAKLRGLLESENQRADAAIDRETTAEEAEGEHRLALSEALGLGTGAPWDAIRERAAELHRMAAETQQPEAQAPVAPEAPAVCEGFQWIGQSFAICDRCGQPAWEHAGEDVPVEGAGPFDNRRTVRPWAPGQADRIRAKWGTPAAVQQPKEARVSQEICPAFPDHCPNLRTVDPEPGVHLGGVRCGCADEDPS